MLKKYQDLAPSAKEKALQHHVETLPDWWSGDVIERAKEEGAPLGFCIESVLFSGFCSQGDGACWIGHVVVHEFLEAHPDPDYFIIGELAREGGIAHTIRIYHSGHYYHEQTMHWDGGLDRYGASGECILQGILKGASIAELQTTVTDTQLDALDKWMMEEARDFAKKIYRWLEEAYEYETSEEALIDAAEANDWLFDEDGKVVYDVATDGGDFSPTTTIKEQ